MTHMQLGLCICVEYLTTFPNEKFTLDTNFTIFSYRSGSVRYPFQCQDASQHHDNFEVRNIEITFLLPSFL